VTGASGFIGQHMIESAMGNSDIEILGVSRSGAKNTLQVSNYMEAPAGDILIHLAEESNAEKVAQQSQLHENQTSSTLDSLLKKKYSRIVYSSSSVVYGENSKLPHNTKDRTYSESPYSRIKILSEETVLSSPKGIVVRIGNVYGPGMSRFNVLSQILNQVPLHGDLVIRDSTPVRDFIWVDDVVSGILELACQNLSGDSSSQIYNLGTSVGTSIGDLARQTLDLVGQSDRCLVSTNESGKESSIILNYSQTTLACGWIPRKILRDGLEELAAETLRARK
jgi:nucleoside-diphosphate-sugar epimerase